MNTSPEARAQPWDATHELLAQLIEEVGILAADHRRKKPREVPRPAYMRRGRRRRPAGGSGGGGMDHAFGVMLSTTRAPL
ncbi:hypothetical protein SAMN05421505_12090 [Sinosporangium album]|uniref:Uncharacterized protein n=1 Tax=Sinosporangium album TaxID=504805 RepID=A0A1G8EGB6_9ACTN|nr:hypothetical protein [Sinosporangium album]SDH68962.1 hypothetical protein SAMN05421505_12090 [Sinosporangium album]